MKVIIAPDKFKGSASAAEVARAIGAGIRRVLPDATTVLMPVADGGEGTVEAMLAAGGGVKHAVVVTGPLGEPVKAEYGILENGTAVIEMAQASGFSLVPPERRDPTRTTTFGTGELIEAALDHGCREIIVGVGGSATCDAGAGAVQALGAKLLKKDGTGIGFGGAELITIERIDVSGLDPRIGEVRVLVASDVDSPLYGPLGAAHVFAPQKGASPEQVFLLEQGLIHFADVVKRDLGVDVASLPGGGAAGGLGAGLVAFLGAQIRLGAELVADAVGLRQAMIGADLVITGEGSLDEQSARGKAPAVVARLAKELSVPVIAIVGQLGEGYDRVLEVGIEKAYSITGLAGSADEAIRDPSRYIEEAATRAAREFLA